MQVAKLDKATFDAAEALLVRLIRADGYRLKADGDLLKIALIENLLQALKYKHQVIESELTFEEFVESDISVEGGLIRLSAPTQRRISGSGTPPLLLQPKLLMYLLLFHQQAYAVYDIIENFVRHVWDQLELLDFKRTRTGVTRCFTNTRFAAHTLRDYGLLQFTKRQAYKTWVLSLPGFIVASRVLESGTWSLNRVPERWMFDLHTDIHEARVSLNSYEQFVDQLEKICQSRTEVFSTFEDILRYAYGLMGQYWSVITNPEKTKKDRQKDSMAILRQLAGHPRIDVFYKEFSMALLTDELLRRIGTGAGNGDVF